MAYKKREFRLFVKFCNFVSRKLPEPFLPAAFGISQPRMVVYDEAGRHLPKSPVRFPSGPRVPSRDQDHLQRSFPASGSRGATLPLSSPLDPVDLAPVDRCAPPGTPPSKTNQTERETTVPLMAESCRGKGRSSPLAEPIVPDEPPRVPSFMEFTAAIWKTTTASRQTKSASPEKIREVFLRRRAR